MTKSEKRWQQLAAEAETVAPPTQKEIDKMLDGVAKWLTIVWARDLEK